MGRAANKNSAVAAPAPTRRGANASDGRVATLQNAQAAAQNGDLNGVCSYLTAQSDTSAAATAQRLDLLKQLAQATLLNYRQPWSDKLTPMLRELGYNGSPGANAETLLGAPYSGWEGGYEGCARTLADDALSDAVKADNRRLQAGKRETSGLRHSWVAENIAVSWRSVYLSQLGRHLEGHLPGALEQFTAANTARREELQTQAGGRDKLNSLFDRDMLWPMWMQHQKAVKAGTSSDPGSVLLDELAKKLAK